MSTRITALAIATAAALGAACQDSSTAPRAASGPRFSAARDTGGGSGGGTQQTHFVANGDLGSVNWASGDSGGTGGGFSFTTGFLNVSRGGTAGNPQTFLFYVVNRTDCDIYFNCTYTLLQGGSGLIPNRDLSGSGKQLRLNTNTANNPDFFVYAGGGGLVSVTFQANGFYVNTFSGTSSLRVGTFTDRSQGSWTSASADAGGTVVGVTIDRNQSSGMGSNRNVTIDIFR